MMNKELHRTFDPPATTTPRRNNRGRRIGLTLGLLGLATCSRATPPLANVATQPASAALPSPSGERTISLFITGQLKNTTEPCGCSSVPLGDVARIAALLRTTAGRGLLLDAGGLRYDWLPVPAPRRAQSRLKADFLEQTWQELGAVGALQPNDLMGAAGAAELKGSQRLACNLRAVDDKQGTAFPAGLLQSSTMRVVDGVRIGIIGIADPAATWPPGIEVTAPVAAAKLELDRLRTEHAQAIVALTGLGRDAARRLARQLPGIDLVVAGGDHDLVDGLGRAEQIGATLLVVPGVEGQRLVRVDLHLPSQSAAPSWELRLTASQQRLQVAGLRQQQAALQRRLADLRQDPQAEPAFIETTAAELTRITTAIGQAAQLSPASTGHVTAERVEIRHELPRDPDVARAMAALDRRIGEANLQALQGPPPPARPGQPGYVGVLGCQGSCHFHDDAVEFWQKTLHARAFPTLVQVGKQLSYDCVGCHVVGFDEAGGANLWSLARAGKTSQGAPGTPDLRNVQCEACHGPGSLHVGAPSKYKVGIVRPTQDRCLVCHTKEHSDTFDFVPYLRDILGPGHGSEKRAALGEGPTGHELRATAIQKQTISPPASNNKSPSQHD